MGGFSDHSGRRRGDWNRARRPRFRAPLGLLAGGRDSSGPVSAPPGPSSSPGGLRPQISHTPRAESSLSSRHDPLLHSGTTRMHPRPHRRLALRCADPHSRCRLFQAMRLDDVRDGGARRAVERVPGPSGEPGSGHRPRERRTS